MTEQLLLSDFGWLLVYCEVMRELEPLEELLILSYLLLRSSGSRMLPFHVGQSYVPEMATAAT